MSDRQHLNNLQRQRRSKFKRIDYANVSPEAVAVLASLHCSSVGTDNSSLLNRIVVEWAEMKSVVSLE